MYIVVVPSGLVLSSYLFAMGIVLATPLSQATVSIEQLFHLPKIFLPFGIIIVPGSFPLIHDRNVVYCVLHYLKYDGGVCGAQYMQYSAKKKETFHPETGKIFFPIDVGQIIFAPLY